MLWTPQLGYPPYEVDLGSGPIALPYVCFGTHLGVPWQLGKQAPDGEVYARRIYSAPCNRPYLPQYPGVDDADLRLFLKDAALNFALNQSIDYADDPGLTADIALYRHLASEAGGWKAQAEQLNDFGAAYHRMQTRFEDGYGLYTQELKAVEQRLVETRARTRVHTAMVQLISQRQLGGRHYWMGLPGFDTHPCPDILPDPPRFTMVKDLESQVYVPMPVPPPSFLPDAADAPPSPSLSAQSSSSLASIHSTPTPVDRRTAGKRPKNTCPHCCKTGHFGRECRNPHIYCAVRGYCKLRQKSSCQYPRAHGKQGRIIRKKLRALEVEGFDEDELARDAGDTLFEMDWSV
jgi:hypothetical protein